LETDETWGVRGGLTLLYRLGVLRVVDRLRTSRIRPDFIPETLINTFMIQTAADLEKINTTATSIPTFDPGNSCPLNCKCYRGIKNCTQLSRVLNLNMSGLLHKAYKLLLIEKIRNV